MIATHSTPDRLGAVRRLLHRWIPRSSPRGCVSVSILLCTADEWAELQHTLDRDSLMRGHVHITIVLGPWRKFYPFNVMRNAAMEPWNSAHYGLLPSIRAPACAAACRAAHEAARGSTDPGYLDSASPPASVVAASMVANLTTRPWLLVLDADGVLSSNERVLGDALLNAELAVANRTSELEFPRTLYTFVTLEANGNKSVSLLTTAQFLETNSVDPTDSMSFVRRKFDSLRSAQNLDVLMPLRAWSRLSPGDSPVAGSYGYSAEPYFASRPPIPYFSEAYRGRGYDKSGWYWELFHGAEYRGRVIPGQFIFMDTSLDDWRDDSGAMVRDTPPYRGATWRHWALFTSALRHRNCSIEVYTGKLP